MTLTPYDEFPVHQSPYPFSYIPATDFSWDEGYWFGVFSADQKVFLGIYLRVNPNTDMIGGCALLNVAGHQLTLRFNRCWRRNFALEVGPLRMTFEEPLKRIRLVMEPNDSGLEFDVLWEGTSPAFLEDHHIATYRGRRTTDQTRYSQPGKATGWIRRNERTWQVEPEGWSGSRDHSWGLYASRPPLSPPPSLLPPPTDEGPKRAMRFWTCFRSEPYSGFFHLHETADGIQCKMNDVFGTPFGGHIFKNWNDEEVELRLGTHQMEFNPGTRILKKATFTLTDARGREWRQVYDIETPPWVVQPMGAFPGSWTDGGTFFTYHGSEELAFEFEEADYSQQPFEYKPHAVSGAQAAEGGFNTGTSQGTMVHGPEYLARVTTYAPDGSVTSGSAQVELFINGPYHPYGFE